MYELYPEAGVGEIRNGYDVLVLCEPEAAQQPNNANAKTANDENRGNDSMKEPNKI